MFDLAEKYGTPLFSSSALRFAQELADYPNELVHKESLEMIASTGPGEYKNYSVHQFEMIVSLVGTGATKIKSLSSDHGRLLVVQYADGKQATMLQMPEMPFQLSIQLRNGQGVFIKECTEIFTRLIHSILDFFETRQSPVPKLETLEIMALIEAGSKALNHHDTWIQVEHYNRLK